ncbi:AAA family ATPase [Croceimicrobium sp.]|uniref:AAA family ATPase n=1 Tax=Croceimicrobium sp. TaxID=2828340 RepID=UPI003BAD0E1F
MERRIIVVSGPESSGKSQLCRELSEKLNIPWVAEYARMYLEKNGPEYSKDSLQEIYQSHLAHQAQALQKQTNGNILLDTDSFNYLIWNRRVFDFDPPLLMQQILKEQEHRYLLCYPDLEWEADPLRENPIDRLDIFHENLALIQAYNRPYAIVKGQKKERLSNALDALQKLL